MTTKHDLWEMVQIIELAAKFFGNYKKALEWIIAENNDLIGLRPMDAIANGYGNVVMKLLTDDGRIKEELSNAE